MHVADQLFAEAFEVRIGDEQVSPEAVFPDWSLLDRFFHVGGPHGDFSYFDFWPPRKEVRVAASQPVSLLEAINAHGITRLALPPGDGGADCVLRTGPSTWAEQASAMERLIPRWRPTDTDGLAWSSVVWTRYPNRSATTWQRPWSHVCVRANSSRRTAGSLRWRPWPASLADSVPVKGKAT